MPTSSALSMTLRDASRSIRSPPKLLQPSPTTETLRPDLPRVRCCIAFAFFASSPTMSPRRPSIQFSAGLRDHLRPPRELALDEGAECLGRTRNHFAGICGEALVHVRLREYAHDVGVDPRDDLLRRASRHHHAVPHRDVVT